MNGTPASRTLRGVYVCVVALKLLTRGFVRLANRTQDADAKGWLTLDEVVRK